MNATVIKGGTVITMDDTRRVIAADVLIEGDRAIATCHTMVAMHGDNGFSIGRLSASRLELLRQPQGDWKIVHRQNFMLNGNPEGPALLGRLREGPWSA